MPFCQKCGEAYQKTDQFCPKCGSTLSTKKATPQPPKVESIGAKRSPPKGRLKKYTYSQQELEKFEQEITSLLEKGVPELEIRKQLPALGCPEELVRKIMADAQRRKKEDEGTITIDPSKIFGGGRKEKGSGLKWIGGIFMILVFIGLFSNLFSSSSPSTTEEPTIIPPPTAPNPTAKNPQSTSPTSAEIAQIVATYNQLGEKVKIVSNNAQTFEAKHSSHGLIVYSDFTREELEQYLALLDQAINLINERIEVLTTNEKGLKAYSGITDLQFEETVNAQKEAKKTFEDARFKVAEVLVAQEMSTSSEQTSSDECPQFSTLKLVHSSSLGKDVVYYDEYSAHSEDSNSVNGWNLEYGYIYLGDRYVYCHKGNAQGQNVNYYYCGESSESPLGAVKQVVDNSGNIKETLTKNIVLVYDENKEFLKTICS